MTWFKLDDHCWSHPKFISLSSTAFGVWARVGDWCADQMTDGFVDMPTVLRICPEPPKIVAKAVAELVAANGGRPGGPGLWVPRGSGHIYHDWADHQPSRADIEANRAAGRERQRAARERRQRAAEGASVTPIRAGGAP